MEAAVISGFILVLLICVATGTSILYAMIFGLVCFSAYGLKKGYGIRSVGNMALSGVKTIKNIILIFLLISMLTALWRGAGTISLIIGSLSKFISPSAFLLFAFLINCAVSYLTGTSFGTAATVGVICMTMAQTLGQNPAFAGGAALAGAYFGDRCSPVSTSANLVAELTETDMYENIKGMIKTSVVPFIFSCAVYYFLGMSAASGNTEVFDANALFSGSFDLHPAAILPAAAVLVLPLLRQNVKRTVLVSLITALILCHFLQGFGWEEIGKMMLFGFKAEDPALGKMMNGGGLLSMLKVIGNSNDIFLLCGDFP